MEGAPHLKSVPGPDDLTPRSRGVTPCFLTLILWELLIDDGGISEPRGAGSVDHGAFFKRDHADVADCIPLFFFVEYGGLWLCVLGCLLGAGRVGWDVSGVPLLCSPHVARRDIN